jgi:competence ComEA-like helix-hairpin-helix protein
MMGSLSYIYCKRQVLCLAFACLLFYLIKQYNFDDEHETGQDRSSPYTYVELAEVNRPPVVLRLDNDSGLEHIARSLNLSQKPRNGDRIILHSDGRYEFSRMSGIKSLALGVPIGINSGSADDLQSLPGIGVKLARRIVDWRKANNGFKSIDELEEVDGIGKKKMEAIRPLVSLD